MRGGLLAIVAVMVALGSVGTNQALVVEGPTGRVCASPSEDVSCSALAASGQGNATSGGAYGVSASGTGDATCYSPACRAVSGTGDAGGADDRQGETAVSGTGDTYCGMDGCQSASGTGDSSCERTGCVAVSGTGQASCQGLTCFAVSLTCHADGGFAVGGGSAVEELVGSDAACQDVAPGSLLP